MTGYQSKRAAAQDKLTQPAQEPVRDEILQAITDPENQPSQYGTVTLDYHFEQIKKWEDRFERMSKNFEKMSDKVLAQPAQGSVCDKDSQGCWYKRQHFDPIYNTPPQRPWVDLTDNQIEQIYYDLVKIHRGAPMPWGQIQFGKVLQAAIREANK